MKPQFDNKGLNILYYTLFYGSGIAAGLALIGYKEGIASLQEGLHWNLSNHFITIGSIVLFLAVGYFFGGLDKTGRKKEQITTN